MLRTIRWLAPCALAILSAPRAAGAQVIPGEIVPPGSTVATSTDADSARVNPGAVPLARAASARFTHVSELRARTTALSADALTFTSPLAFGLAGAVGVTWQRPQTPGARGDVVTAEAGLSYAVTRRMGVGARLRVSGAGGDNALAPLDGAAALDAGFAWRLGPQLSIGVVAANLLGPRVPAIGLDRAAIAGIGLRPTATDDATFGLDASVAQSGTGWVRAGARVRLPWLGYLRAEGAVDYPAAGWRAGAGIDVAWGQASAGGGAFGGSSPAGEGPLGFYATARVEPERDRGVPTPGTVVAIPLESGMGSRGLARMVLRLERLRRDPAVRGVLFAPRGGVGGLAGAEELREGFARLRAAGKRVVCHLTDATASAYYACSAADSITVDPAGALRLVGLHSGYFSYLGRALRELGVRTEFVRIGIWKEAPEQLTLEGATPAARAQQEQLLDDDFANLCDGVARSRRLPPDVARALLTGGPYTARRARELGLVDAVGTREAAERAAGRALDAEVVDIEDYAALRPRRWAPARGVVVLHIAGDVVDGESFELPALGVHLVGDRSVTELVDQLAGDSRVAAVVLRIDSGGGSAMAGELIWRAVDRLARRKPVVASFGETAASAAYYIAAPSREIVALPSSLTGSIGIFYGKADISPLLGRLGVSVESLRRGARADMESIYRPSTPDEVAAATTMIREFYELFLRRVAQGRRRTPAAIDRVAEGRIFSGVRAQGIGLVDRVGGLMTAIERARTLAGLAEDYEVREVPVESDGLLSALTSLFAASAPHVGAERLLATSELRRVLGWLIAIAQGGQGRAMAMTDWPLLPP